MGFSVAAGSPNARVDQRGWTVVPQRTINVSGGAQGSVCINSREVAAVVVTTTALAYEWTDSA